jgi:hypothetical protein
MKYTPISMGCGCAHLYVSVLLKTARRSSDCSRTHGPRPSYYIHNGVSARFLASVQMDILETEGEISTAKHNHSMSVVHARGAFMHDISAMYGCEEALEA